MSRNKLSVPLGCAACLGCAAVEPAKAEEPGCTPTPLDKLSQKTVLFQSTRQMIVH